MRSCLRLLTSRCKEFEVVDVFVTRKIGSLLFAAALAAAPLQATLAQSSDPAWLDELNLQLLIEKDCEVLYYMQMKEGEIGAVRSQEARVQCSDGRQFDAERIEPAQDFHIKLCDIQLC